MSMQRTIRVRLKPAPDQRRILLETLVESTACFNAVAAYGWMHQERNGVELHKATYYPLRAEHPKLPAQLIVSARTRATEAVKSALTRARQGRKTGCPAGRMVPIRYDARSYRLLDGSASLASVNGRQVVPFASNPHAAGLLAQATGTDSADLVLRSGKLWLHVVLTLPDVPFTDTGAAIGVDLGLTRPAVTSGARFLGQKRWREIDRRSFRLKRSLQAKGTPASSEAGRQDRSVSARLRPHPLEAHRPVGRPWHDHRGREPDRHPRSHEATRAGFPSSPARLVVRPDAVLLGVQGRGNRLSGGWGRSPPYQPAMWRLWAHRARES